MLLVHNRRRFVNWNRNTFGRNLRYIKGLLLYYCVEFCQLICFISINGDKLAKLSSRVCIYNDNHWYIIRFFIFFLQDNAFILVPKKYSHNSFVFLFLKGIFWFLKDEKYPLKIIKISSTEEDLGPFQTSRRLRPSSKKRHKKES